MNEDVVAQRIESIKDGYILSEADVFWLIAELERTRAVFNDMCNRCTGTDHDYFSVAWVIDKCKEGLGK